MKVVLFDLEGTLVKAWGPITIKELKNRTKSKLLELGIPRRILSRTDKFTIMLNAATKYADNHFDPNRRRLFNIELDKVLKAYEVSAAQNSVLFNETFSVLRELEKIDAILGIVTNTSREALEIILSKHSIGEFFQVAITREDVRQMKPNSEGIQLALERLHREDDDFFFVGDSVFDVTAATKAKGISILVCRNCSSKATKLANYTIQSLLEIPKIVNEIEYNEKKLLNTRDK